MTNERAEYLKSIATFLQREDDFLLYTSDDSLEQENDEAEDEPYRWRTLLLGIVVGMALGIGLLIGPMVVGEYVGQWRASMATAPVADEQRAEVARPGWMMAREILFLPTVTEDGCSVMCGKTQDDILLTLGNGCGTRQIALCQARWGLGDGDE